MVQEERLVDGQSLCLLVPSVPFGKICSNEKKILSGKDVFFTHDLTLINGQKVLGQEAGGLEKWKASLIEMKLLINGMSSEEKALLPYYLCADMERVQKIRPDLHNISEYPVIERCFRLIVELYTVFVARHMPPNTRALQEAFTLL